MATPQKDDQADRSDGGSDAEAQSELNQETADDAAGEMKVDGNILKQMAAAVNGINKTIELLAKRMDSYDESKAKRDTGDVLQGIHSKDVDKPVKYDGKQWAIWSTDFTAFLERRDRRWGKLLKAIDKHSIDPLTENIKSLIAYEVDIKRGTLVEDFTSQLYDYLKNYTTGETQSRVISGGKANSWEAWRVLSDQGKSRRKVEVHEEYKRLMNPPQAPLESIITAIAQWERNLAIHTANSGKLEISEEMKKLILENMCPEVLQEHLADKFEQGLISSYDEHKQAISTFVYRKTKKGKSQGRKVQSLNVLHTENQQAEEDHGQCHDGPEDDANWEATVAALMKQAEEISGKLNALVKGNKFNKQDKGFGKAGGGKGGPGGAAPMQVDHSQKDCYLCGELGHMAANCPNSDAKGGKYGKGDKGGGKAGKGGGKYGKGGKDKGKGGKGGWPPSLQTWRTWCPGPSPTQWTEWWKQGKSNDDQRYKGRANLFEQPYRLSSMQQSDWGPGESWPQPSSTDQVLKSLFNGGNFYKLVEKGPKAKVVNPEKASVRVQNRFEGLEARGDESETTAKPTPMKQAPIEAFIKPISRNRQKKTQSKCQKGSDEENPIKMTPKQAEKQGGSTDDMGLLEFLRMDHGDKVEKNGLRVLRENTAIERLAPLRGNSKDRPRAPNGWEVLSAIVDSGATITAIHPEDGCDYKVEESAASRKGVTYATAGDEDLPNLGEKKMAVLTAEGTLREFHTQVAEVSGPLESVRQLLSSKHCVLFGLGENEGEHLIVNKITGEVNRLRDDGINYLHDMLVVPPDRVNEVQDAMARGESPFTWPGAAR